MKSITEYCGHHGCKILVSGGRGMGCPENFEMLKELADVLGGSELLPLLW